MRKPALACLSICLLVGVCAAVYAQQGASPSAPASLAPDRAKPGSKPAETPQAAPEKPAEQRSTPEDRQRLVVVAHKLEAAPLDPAVAQDREWAMSWVVAAPDIHVRICPSLLADLRRPQYKYRSEIAAQLLISSAAFLIEHPDQADGIAPQSVGGMEGVLKAYSAILKTDPQATAKSLDNFLQKQSEGKLAAAVREGVQGCH